MGRCQAAAIACKNNFVPHDVYLKELETLQELLLNEDCFLPSKTRKISSLCRNAALNIGNDIIRNGQDRAHRIYNTREDNCSFMASHNREISYTFDETTVSSVHIVFCSDLNRNTLPGGFSERLHGMRCNQLLNSPQMHMPKTLCKNFKLIGELNGTQTELLSVTDNRKRAYHLTVNQVFDKLTLIPENNWGDSEKTPVISFDFN